MNIEINLSLDIKKLILSEEWNLVEDIFTLELFKWLLLLLFSPVWLAIKVLVTLIFKLWERVKNWPVFYIKFVLFDLILVTSDIATDVVQGIIFIM